jgi:hypothetical protein
VGPWLVFICYRPIDDYRQHQVGREHVEGMHFHVIVWLATLRPARRPGAVMGTFEARGAPEVKIETSPDR